MQRVGQQIAESCHAFMRNEVQTMLKTKIALLCVLCLTTTTALLENTHTGTIHYLTS